tara:strand:+ start:102 stop:281 length:180 start_codon:yes stop_codon:yes gene_type:complete
MAKKKMKWEIRKMEDNKWGVFLIQKFCKSDEPVCYGASLTKETASRTVERLNRSEAGNE